MRVKYLIGTDEAGLGPNLGPLVIAATVWELDDPVEFAQLDARLSGIVRRDLSPKSEPDRSWLIADSKDLFGGTRGWEHLERGVSIAWGLLRQPLTSWRELWSRCTGDSTRELLTQPWHATFDEPLPRACDRAELVEQVEQVRQGLDEAGVRLRGLHVRAVFPDEFNRLIDVTQNKSTLLSALSLELVGQALAELPAGPTHIQCDKHGGRDRYLSLLQPRVESLVEVVREGADESVYRWRHARQHVEIGFRPRSERYLSVALASMTAKYLRETALRAFNAFWCSRIADLKPTAGYPVDARRFKQQIAAEQQRLGIDDALLWRVK